MLLSYLQVPLGHAVTNKSLQITHVSALLKISHGRYAPITMHQSPWRFFHYFNTELTQLNSINVCNLTDITQVVDLTIDVDFLIVTLEINLHNCQYKSA